VVVVKFPQPARPITPRPPQGREVEARSVPVVSTDARISLRVVTLLEIVSVLGSVLVAVWALVPMYPQSRLTLLLPGALAVWLVINSQRLRGESWHDVGFRAAGFTEAFKLLAMPMLFAIAVMCFIGWKLNSFQRSTHFALNIFVTPLWGIVQQYITQGFLYRRVRSLLVTSPIEERAQVRKAIWLSAACFALVHLPNPTLTLLTFAAGLLWSWVYERAPNLWALGLSHGLLSFVLMHSMPAWFLQSMSIGYKHFLYQKF
jgi:membrane protease YdiL (CAAX protease family)